MKFTFLIHRLTSVPAPTAVFWSGCCAALVFTSVLGVLYFREQTLGSVRHIQVLERQCKSLSNRSTALSASIARMRSPTTFPEDELSRRDLKGNVLKIRDWDHYKKAYLMRDTLALNYQKQYKD